jgi:integrase
MPKGSKDGSVYKRKEKRVVYKGSKREEKEIWQYYARVRYIGLDDQEHEKKRRADPNNYAQACELKRKLMLEIEEELNEPAAQASAVHTFRELAEHCKEKYFIPPVYSGTKIIKGLRSWWSSLFRLQYALDYFADTPLPSITYERIEAYKAHRLSTPVEVKNKDGVVTRQWERSITTVHRELAVLRRTLTIGVQVLKWLPVNPFVQGDPLIIASHEAERMSILDYEEEEQILAWCAEDKKRRFLAPALIFSLETGMRESEQFGVMREDVFMDDRMIIVKEQNTKKLRMRVVPISARLLPIVEQLLRDAPPEPSARIFPVKSVDTAFENALAKLGIKDYRWHDNRHTAIMRMLEANWPESEVMKIVGHREWRTFMRYVALHKRRVRELAEKMDARRDEVMARIKAEQERAPVN